MILKMIKIAFSVALVSGVFQILSSLFLLFMVSIYYRLNTEYYNLERFIIFITITEIQA